MRSDHLARAAAWARAVALSHPVFSMSWCLSLYTSSTIDFASCTEFFCLMPNMLLTLRFDDSCANVCGFGMLPMTDPDRLNSRLDPIMSSLA